MNAYQHTRIRVAFAGFLAAALAPTTPAQEPESASTAAPTMLYVDKAFGFELQVPSGWSYDRTGFFGPGGSLGLLRGSAADGRASLQILVFREQQLPAFPDWIEFFSKQLGSISGIERVRVKGQPDSGRPAAYVVADARLGVDRTRTLYYCVRFDQDTIWVFSYALALGKSVADQPEADADREVSIPVGFTQLTDSLRVFYDPQLARELAAALQRGKDYLARYQLQADLLKLRLDESLRYYEIRIADQPIGFLTRQFTRESEPGQRTAPQTRSKEGLRMRERSYRFATDKTAFYGKIDLFSSRDGETDLYEIWQTHIPPAGTADSEPLITCDQCVREGTTLFSTYTTSRDEGLSEPRPPLKLESSYLGLAWARLLPALLGPEPRPTHAFTIYDSETRTLITHAVRPLGERPLPGSGQSAFAFELRAGFVENPGIAYTDAHGNLLRFEAGDLVLTLSDASTIERKFGPLRSAANERLQQRFDRP